MQMINSQIRLYLCTAEISAPSSSRDGVSAVWYKNVNDIVYKYYKTFRPWSNSPPLYIWLVRVAPDGQHLDSTMYMYSAAVYVHCVDDWNEQGDVICLSHRFQ